MTSNATGRLGNAASKAADRAENIARTGLSKAAEAADTKREQAADAIDTAAEAVDRQGKKLPKPVNQYAGGVKDGLETAADYVRDHDVREMADQAVKTAKDYPIASLLVLGAVVLGGGLLVAGMARNENDSSSGPAVLRDGLERLGPKSDRDGDPDPRRRVQHGTQEGGRHDRRDVPGIPGALREGIVHLRRPPPSGGGLWSGRSHLARTRTSIRTASMPASPLGCTSCPGPLCYFYNMQRTASPAALTLLCVAIAARWPSPASGAQTPAFEVASIKENRSGGMDGVFRRQPGRYTVTNLSLEWIIQTAFGIREYQLVNAPGWTRRRYDIAATFAPADASQDEVRLMLQRLLAERFGLRVHREQRRLTLYELTQSSAGVLGPRLKPSPQTDCAAAPLAAPRRRELVLRTGAGPRAVDR